MVKMVRNYITDGNPCTRDCPDRKPGCNCERRQKWVRIKNEKKAMIKKDRDLQNTLNSMIDENKRRKRKR